MSTSAATDSNNAGRHEAGPGLEGPAGHTVEAAGERGRGRGSPVRVGRVAGGDEGREQRTEVVAMQGRTRSRL